MLLLMELINYKNHIDALSHSGNFVASNINDRIWTHGGAGPGLLILLFPIVFVIDHEDL